MSEKPVPPLGSFAIGGRGGLAGSHRSIDDEQQERQLSTPETLRQLWVKSWLHCFRACPFVPRT